MRVYWKLILVLMGLVCLFGMFIPGVEKIAAVAFVAAMYYTVVHYAMMVEEQLNRTREKIETLKKQREASP